MKSVLLTALGACAAAAQQPLPPGFTQCTWDSKTDGGYAVQATYDLTELRDLGAGGFGFADRVDPNWMYQFAICRNIETNFIPERQWCNETTGSDGKLTKADSPAYQFSATGYGSSCHRLSGSLENAANQPTFDFVWGPSSKPNLGVMMKYTGGDMCHDPKTGEDRQRSVELHFECSNSYSYHLLDNVTVLEETGCLYSVHMHHQSFCPRQCPSVTSERGSGSSPCGDHGFCDYDEWNEEVRCFCNDGWHGPDCNTVGQPVPASKSHAGSIVGALLGGLFGGLLIGGGAYYYYVFVKDGGKLAAEAGFAPMGGSATGPVGGGAAAAGAGEIPGINAGYVAPAMDAAGGADGGGDDDPML